MSTWASITLNEDKLLGLEPVDFVVAATGTINEDLITAELIDTAKDTLREKVLGMMFNLASKLGGEDELFAAIAAEPRLLQRIDTALAYAYLHHFYRGELISSEHVNADKAAYYWMRFEQAAQTLASMANNLVSAGNTLTLKTSRTVAVRSSVNWYDL